MYLLKRLAAATTLGASLFATTQALALPGGASAPSVPAPPSVPAAPVAAAAPAPVPVPVPQVLSPPLPPVVNVPAPPAAVSVPAAPPLDAAPVAPAVAAPRQAVASVTPAVTAGGSASTAAAGGGTQPSGDGAAARRTKMENRRLRRQVMRLRGCLDSLSERQQRFLTLRAGLGESRAMSRAAAARRAGVPEPSARRFERRARSSLREARRSGACGGESPSDGSGGSVTVQFVSTAVTWLGSGSEPGRATTLQTSAGGGSGGAAKDRGERPSGDDEKSPAGAEPRGGPRPFSGTAPDLTGSVGAGAVSTIASEDVSRAWLFVGLAVLALIASGMLITRYSTRPVPAAGPPAEIDEDLVVPPPPPPPAPLWSGAGEAAREENVICRVLSALSERDVDAAAALVHEEVVWPDPLSGHTIHGREAFREHWAHRFGNVSVQYAPIAFRMTGDSVQALVHEVVRNRADAQMYGQYRAQREFVFRDGLIAEMRMRASNGAGGDNGAAGA
jgi:hypothetical protein